MFTKFPILRHFQGTFQETVGPPTSSNDTLRATLFSNGAPNYNRRTRVLKTVTQTALRKKLRSRVNLRREQFVGGSDS